MFNQWLALERWLYSPAGDYITALVSATVTPLPPGDCFEHPAALTDEIRAVLSLFNLDDSLFNRAKFLRLAYDWAICRESYRAA